MSADKRAVHTDALETLGTIIGENEKRDAIHLAVEPVVAAEDLVPGTKVGFVAGGFGRCENPLGIVDPFIEGTVRKGERFWLVLFPRQITSLRHVWTHEAFDAVPDLPSETTKAPAKKARKSATPASAPQAPAQAPAVPREAQRKAHSEEYIRNLADRVGISYGRLLSGAEDWMESQERGTYGGYIVGGAEMEGETVPDEFWMHYEIITGTVVPDELRGSFFTCSC